MFRDHVTDDTKLHLNRCNIPWYVLVIVTVRLDVIAGVGIMCHTMGNGDELWFITSEQVIM